MPIFESVCLSINDTLLRDNYEGWKTQAVNTTPLALNKRQ
jgi:hypothetical protein